MKILFGILPFFLWSCASGDLERFGAREYYQHKVLHLKNNVVTHTTYGQVSYVKSSDHHCFDSVDDREVYTVLASDLKGAINHFYFRKVSYDLKVDVRDGHERLIAQASEDTRLNLEVAYCGVDRYGIFKNAEGEYASVRLAKE